MPFDFEQEVEKLFSKLNLRYIINIAVSVLIALILAPLYMNILDKEVPFLGTNYGKIAKFLLVTFGFVAIFGLILPTFAPYDETEQQLTKFMREKGIVGAPSFRSV